MPSKGGAAASDDTSSGGGGSGGGGNVLKKGPWTAAEDAILMEYVKKHGEGNWNAVQKNSGLSRCGKSCRLRWANHLRPNLKKGSFSPEEERLILELHAKLGNKWARMAAQLPGRTDNEIKNYWNTRVKRRQRSGLPLYPQDIQREKQSHSSLSPSSPSSLHHQKPNFGSHHHLSLFDPMNFSSSCLNRHNISSPSIISSQLKRFRGSNNIGFSHTFSSLPSSSSLFNQNFSWSSQLLPPPQNLQFNCGSYDLNPSPPILRPHFEPDSIIGPNCSSAFSMKLELPSSQLPQPASAASDLANDLIGPSLGRSNSGLLDALLQEAEAMGAGEEVRRGQEDKDGLVDGFLSHTPPPPMAANSGSVFSESTAATPPLGSVRQWEDSSSVHSSSMGVKMKKEPPEEINSVEVDDLSSLLDIIPSTMLVSGLYNDGGEISNGQSSVVTDDDIGLDMHHLPSSLSTTTTSATAMDHDWTIDAWNNMPEMC